MFKVTVDDEVFEKVSGWSVPGGSILLLEFTDGSFRGLTGFIDFLVERADNPQVPA